MEEPAVISLQAGHSPHGVAVGPFSQLSAFAKMRAVEVFPHPRGPENKYACAIFFDSIAFFNVAATNSCPTRFSKLCGLRLVAVTS
jgi:hypothetical protein